MAEIASDPKLCTKCAAAGSTFKCPCKQVIYCGKECQNADWHMHKVKCSYLLDKKLRKAKKEHGNDDINVANARVTAGIAHRNEGRYVDAERYLLEARRIFANLVKGSAAKNILERCFVQDVEGRDADACLHLGQLYRFMKRLEESLSVYQESLRIHRRINGERSESVGRVLRVMAITLHHKGEHSVAFNKLREAQSIFKEIHGPESELVAQTLSQMGAWYREENQLDRSMEMLQEALRIHRLTESDNSQSIAIELNQIGCTLHQQGRLAEARAKYEEATGIQRRLHGEKHPYVATSMYNIGNILSDEGKDDEAMVFFKKALKVKRKVHGEDDSEVKFLLRRIAGILNAQGKHAEASEFLESAR